MAYFFFLIIDVVNQAILKELWSRNLMTITLGYIYQLFGLILQKIANKYEKLQATLAANKYTLIITGPAGKVTGQGAR